jgi:hypothetical protein
VGSSSIVSFNYFYIFIYVGSSTAPNNDAPISHPGDNDESDLLGLFRSSEEQGNQCFGMHVFFFCGHFTFTF